MRITTLFAAFFVCSSAFAKPDMDEGIAMSSFQVIKESSEPLDTMGLSDMYKYGGTYTITKLYPPEIAKISEAFVSHIQHVGSVTNYLTPLGEPIPSALGDIPVKKALEMKYQGGYDRLGEYWIDYKGYETTLTNRSGVIFQGEDTLINDGVINHGVDTIYTEDLMTGEFIEKAGRNTADLNEVTAGLGFTETWKYYPKKGSFEKGVHLMALGEEVMDEMTGEYRGVRALMNLKTGKFRGKYLGPEGLIREDVQYTVVFSRDFYPDEADGCMTYGMIHSPKV